MKPKKVLKANNLPSRYPIFPTIVTWLALDHWNAPQWMYGACGLLFVIFWLNAIYNNVTQEEIDLFKNDETK